MITLFIDTSFADVSIALLKDNKIINKIVKSIPNEHSKYALTYIDEVLKKSDIKPEQVNNIMVVNGPGSFTGIRIGLTIAKVYAYLLKIEVTLVSSLKSIALSKNNNNDYVMSLIDAKNNNYYLGLYDKDYNEVTEEHFSNIEEINNLLKEYPNIKIISNSDLKTDNYNKINELDIEKIVEFYKDKKRVNAHQVLPNYLKLPQVLEKNV